jgi:hypothetical protein
MLAGRPHEAVGNGSPRWMTAAPRKRGTEPGLQAGSPTFHPSSRRRRNPIAVIYKPFRITVTLRKQLATVMLASTRKG